MLNPKTYNKSLTNGGGDSKDGGVQVLRFKFRGSRVPPFPRRQPGRERVVEAFHPSLDSRLPSPQLFPLLLRVSLDSCPSQAIISPPHPPTELACAPAISSSRNRNSPVAKFSNSLFPSSSVEISAGDDPDKPVLQQKQGL